MALAEYKETDIDALRIALMQSYDSQVTNHAGYIIAISVGFATILISKDATDFLLKYRLFFVAILVFYLSTLCYFASRTAYWSWLRAIVLEVKAEEAKRFKRKTLAKNLEYFAIDHFLTTYTKKRYFPIKISRELVKLDLRYSFGISWLVYFAIVFAIISVVALILNIPFW